MVSDRNGGANQWPVSHCGYQRSNLQPPLLPGDSNAVIFCLARGSQPGLPYKPPQKDPFNACNQTPLGYFTQSAAFRPRAVANEKQIDLCQQQTTYARAWRSSTTVTSPSSSTHNIARRATCAPSSRPASAASSPANRRTCGS